MRLVSKTVLAAFAAVASLALTVEARAEEQMTKSLTGLQYKDTKVGTGATPKIGQTAVVHYTGWLYNNGEKGKKFDFSRRSRPALRISARPGAGDQGLGRGRRNHEGRRQAHAGRFRRNSATARAAPAASFRRTPG